MAIDFDEVYETLHSIQTKIDDIMRVVYTANAGKVTVPCIGDIEFTAGQKTILRNEYNSLKAEIATLWQGLP